MAKEIKKSEISAKEEIGTLKLAKESLASAKDETVSGIHEGKKPKFGKSDFGR